MTTFTIEGGAWQVMNGPGGDSTVLFAVSAAGIRTNLPTRFASSLTGTALLGVTGSNVIMGTLVSNASASSTLFNVWVCMTDSAGRGYYIPAKTSVF